MSEGYVSRSRRGSRPQRRQRALLLLALLAVLLLVLVGPPNPRVAAGADIRESALDDSTAFELLRRLAREDTLGVPEIDYVYGSWIEVEDQRPTLEDILHWCIENEKHRLDDVENVTFRRRVRVLQLYEPEKEDGEFELEEAVFQVYARPPDQMVSMKLGERTYESKEKESDVETEVRVTTANRELASLPFFFEQLSDYDFAITERRFLGDRILYRIEFSPHSEFAALPTGSFLVDTGDYQILRAEFSLTENVPYPVFLKSVDRVDIQRRKTGGVWWIERTDVEVTLRDLPFLGMPRKVQMEMQIEDVRVNTVIPDSVWALPGDE
ncbi:MAG: hypothetical protein KDA27_13640 [Candidatus Eisenbacteria bacterium]|uniref:Uncharacterized protein n=1 Tax=Eiseniibacteriota bacterium TaxID=2212470 RepID=A0A956NE71_UNCEI|nr:hypothetical protein [Candidatus Eisenbacteria bacterium]MCB9463744.1 hypothetical protein [Candidatus Eisenbacteria bacterium]